MTPATKPRTPDELFALDALLTDDERDTAATVRAVLDEHVRPHVARWYLDGALPARDLAKLFGDLDRDAEQRAATRVGEVDADNTAWLCGVVDHHGWPGASLVGEDGAQAAWLLVQHADQDPGFQRSGRFA